MSEDAVVSKKADDRWALLFSEALRALQYQQGILDNLRSRAVLLLTGAALVSSLLGASAIKDRMLGKSGTIAMGALVVVLLAALVICSPLWSWTFSIKPVELRDNIIDGHDIDSIHQNLAEEFAEYYEQNERKLWYLKILFIIGLVALVIELFAWSYLNFRIGVAI